jgi:hypothetical protein
MPKSVNKKVCKQMAEPQKMRVCSFPFTASREHPLNFLLYMEKNKNYFQLFVACSLPVTIASVILGGNKLRVFFWPCFDMSKTELNSLSQRFQFELQIIYQ